MWDEITYSFQNGVVVEVWEWISIFITHFADYLITYRFEYIFQHLSRGRNITVTS